MARQARAKAHDLNPRGMARRSYFMDVAKARGRRPCRLARQGGAPLLLVAPRGVARGRLAFISMTGAGYQPWAVFRRLARERLP